MHMLPVSVVLYNRVSYPSQVECCFNLLVDCCFSLLIIVGVLYWNTLSADCPCRLSHAYTNSAACIYQAACEPAGLRVCMSTLECACPWVFAG